VGLLIGGDLQQVAVELLVESGRSELRLGVVLQTLAVEGVLEMFQGQSIVELMEMSGWYTCSTEGAHTISASVMAYACLLARGAAVLKPAAATRAIMDWEYFILN